jgi:aryl-alcohol dehydrogenase-like predicted oxidoreductase
LGFIVFEKLEMLITWCSVQLKDLAPEKGCTPGQLMLARLLARGEDMVPISGFVFSSNPHCRSRDLGDGRTKKEKYLDDNMGPLKVKLTVEEMRKLRDALRN